MQDIKMLVAFALLCFIFYSVFRAAQAGKISSQRIFLPSLLALLLTPVAFWLFLYVVADRVPAQAKGGLFGTAGGLIMGLFMLNGLLAAVNLGVHLRKQSATQPSAGET